MDFKTTLSLYAIVIISFGIIAATSIIGSEDAFAGKSCNPHGCKGDRGYYTSEGHHCFDGSSNCHKRY